MGVSWKWDQDTLNVMVTIMRQCDVASTELFGFEPAVWKPECLKSIQF